MSSQPQSVSLDGRTLEGGGQLLRLALSLSALTYLPVHVWDIRANRVPRKPYHPAGGLKPAHLAAVEWLANATRADTRGMFLGSSTLHFTPLCRGPGMASSGDIERSCSRANNESTAGVWQAVCDGDRLTRRDSRIPLSSPGSVCLILQAILPYLLFHSLDTASTACQEKECRAVSVPLRVIIEGGTNVSKSPSIEYFSQVLIPLLVKKIGIPKIATTLIKRGWSSGRADVGAVQFDLTPLTHGSKLSKFDFSNRGEVASMHISILAPASVRNSLRKKVTERLLARYPEADILYPIDEDTGNGTRLYLLVVAETSNGYRLGQDCLWGRKLNSATPDSVSAIVIKALERDLDAGGCVDEYMQDQLVVFQALAEGRSTVDTGKKACATLHTQTARWVAGQVLGLTFDEQGNCNGCGFEVGEDFAERKVENAVADLGKVQIESNADKRLE
ncbi:MAG: hypothetical protein LQ345_001514 [Seirophora villosa]|nr:MAG: hypothetical protein LQ345_001514 [Seirophora villosa]